MSVAKIKKNDVVVAISGTNQGKSGKIMQIMPGGKRAIVEGLNLVKKTVRKSQDSPQGGITDREAPIAISNLMLFCTHCKKGVRTEATREGDQRVRKCKACGHTF